MNLLLQHLACHSVFIVTVWLTDSGLWPRRSGSVLLHQFEEGLSDQSLHFYATAYSEVHVMLSVEYGLDHSWLCLNKYVNKINKAMLCQYILSKGLVQPVRRKSLSHLCCPTRKPVANEAFLL